MRENAGRYPRRYTDFPLKYPTHRCHGCFLDIDSHVSNTGFPPQEGNIYIGITIS